MLLKISVRNIQENSINASDLVEIGTKNRYNTYTSLTKGF